MRIGELTKNYTIRAREQGLRVDCAMGGNPNSKVAFVGEAPGEHEVRNRAPFIGTSGRFLFKALKRRGDLNRGNTYQTNVIKRQLQLTPNSDARETVSADEIAHWEADLWWELSHLENLEVVVACGNQACKALLGFSGIRDLVGSIYEVTNPVDGRQFHVVCQYNPAYPMREPGQEIVFNFALAKINKILNGEYQPVEHTYLINPTPSEVVAFLADMKEESDKHGTPVAFDIESSAHETACIGFGNGEDTAMCINFRDESDNRFALEDEIMLFGLIQEFLLTPGLRLVAQSGSFDSYWLSLSDRIYVPPIWHDTLLSHHCIYPGLPHNLGFLTMQFTSMPFYKDELHTWKEGGDINQFWEYNCKDVIATWIAAQKLHKELRTAGLEELFYGHIMRAQPYLTNMTIGGVPIDAELQQAMCETSEANVKRLLGEFHSAVHVATGDDDYNPSPASWKQLRTLYFGRLELVGRGTSTDAVNRKRMREHPKTSPEARKMLEIQEQWATENKFLTTYARMKVDPDGRARCEYKQAGTTSAPGRLSSAGLLYGTGANLQNQPERSQPMYVLPEGYVFVYYDLAQAEARYVGWDANIPHWIEDFERARVDSSFDCHRSLASRLFNVPYDEVPTKDRDDDGEPTIRFVAKRCRHGLNYRMAPERLAETTGLPLQAATSHYETYHRANPQLRTWWKLLQDTFVKERVLYNAYGRRLPLLRRVDDEALESIVAFKPQSTIGDKCIRVVYLCHEDPRWPHGKARMALNVHDANIAIAHHTVAKTVGAIMKEHAEEPIEQDNWKQPLIIPADLKISYPVAWDLVDGEIVYRPDEDEGVHRWGFLKPFDLEAA